MPGSADPFIRLRGVRKVYRRGSQEHLAVSDATFDVMPGELVSMVGPSGCGKSTLLRIVAGLRPATRGRVEVASRAVRGPVAEVGMVFQAPVLLHWRPILENVLLPAELAGRDARTYRARARELLDLVGLADFAAKRPRELSGGMQQRVAIARALSFDPQLLLMDEPFGALDEITRDRMNEELLQIWEKTRKTVILVTHSIDEAVLLSTKIVVMSARPGRIVDVIDSTLPAKRTLETRETPAAIELAHRVREGLKAGHSYD